MSNLLNFPFADSIAGYVSSFDWENDRFEMRTSDERDFTVELTETTSGEIVRNLGEDYIDVTGSLRDLLAEGRFLHVWGVFYPEVDHMHFEAKHIVLMGHGEKDFRFEQPDWWVKQIGALADFYLNAQFPGEAIDWANYRTKVNLEGEKTQTHRQETDTISRLIYGFSSAFMLTGDERYLEAARSGTKYLRDHFRGSDPTNEIHYWYHAIDIDGKKERKILASEFGDDYDAIPAYEQIYALAGPTQTFRVTGDPEIKKDIDKTLHLFDTYFLDKKRGGYFSHVDPIDFDPKAVSLGHNRSRKNWNSVGDHAPAYLINAWLATEEPRYAEMLVRLGQIITERFPDDTHSPFVQERFHDDWSRDTTWGWQQDRAVVGHNLKIAWNLMRIHHLENNEAFVKLAKKITRVMPAVGSDQQRGGWYDVVERTTGKAQKWHRFTWHNRKAWWQQEQAILAYLIMAGSLPDTDHMRIARESSSYYNAWFLDHDSGGVYFNVLSEGIPFLTGTERFKGSHSMSGYHSFELAFLATVYTNLLNAKQPMTLHFRPQSNASRTLRVAPDILPKGSVRIDAVTIDGKKHREFNPHKLVVQLPESKKELDVKVTLVPAHARQALSSSLQVAKGTATVSLAGKLNKSEIPQLQGDLKKARMGDPQRVILNVKGLESISEEGVRTLAVEKQKMPISVDFYIVGSSKDIKAALKQGELIEEAILVDNLETVDS